MRVVLDTNVLVSGLLTPDGTCGQLVDLMLEGVFNLCVDERILTEYESVLRRPRLDIPPASIDVVIAAVRLLAEPIAALPLRADLPDENDMPFLEVAAAVDALIVTGNPRHFPKRASKGVVIVSPAEFLELVRRSM